MPKPSCHQESVTSKPLPLEIWGRLEDGRVCFFFFLLFLFLFLLFKPGVSIASLCSATTSGREILFER